MTAFTSEQIAIRDMTRDFVRREIIPFAAQWDRDETVPLATVLRLGKLGLFGVCAPAEWNGADADFLAYMLMTEELAYGDAGIQARPTRRRASCVRWRAARRWAAC